MEILGVGPLEIAFILIIALIVLGPKDMAKAGLTMGRFMRRVVMSDTWKVLQNVSRELRNLPTRMMREAGVEDLQKQLAEVKQVNRDIQQQLSQIKQSGNEIGGLLNSQTKISVPEAPAESETVEPELPDGLSAWVTPPSGNDYATPEVQVNDPGPQDPSPAETDE